MPSDAEAWKSPEGRLRSRYGTGRPVGKPPRRAAAGSSTPSKVTEWLPEARMPSASQSSLMRTPGASAGISTYAYRSPPSSSAKRTDVSRMVAAGAIVQKTLWPSMRQPPSVRTASVRGRVRSCPRSLIAAAITMPSEAIRRSDPAKARSRRALPAARAIRQRRARLRTTTRCMLTPIATEASPRARRPEATITSWMELTPRPPSSSGTGAAKYPACRSASMLSNG